jgi:hypothetical protein
MNENQTTSEVEITGDVPAVQADVVAETAVTTEAAATEVSAEVVDIIPTVEMAEVIPAVSDVIA